MTQAKRTASRQRPWEQGSEGAPSSFGAWLRRQRELREITLREIADASKISLRYLEALETDRFDLLPASVFARGFLREYSRYVGLNADEVVNHYLYATQSLEPESPPSGPRRVAAPSSASSATYVLLFIAALVVLVALVFFASVWAERQRREGEVPVMAPPPVLGAAEAEAAAAAPAVGSAAAAPAATTVPGTPQGDPAVTLAAPAGSEVSTPPGTTLPTAPVTPGSAAAPLADLAAAPAAPPSSALRVELDFIAECWFEARVDDGAPQSQTRIQGESLVLDAQRKVVLTLGNGGGVRISVNGKPFATGAESGQVVRDLVIDLAAAGGTP